MVFPGVVNVLGVRGPGFGSVQPISSIANKHDTASKAEKIVTPHEALLLSVDQLLSRGRGKKALEVGGGGGGGIAQLVERPTQKPGTILTRVRVPVATRDFFSQS